MPPASPFCPGFMKVTLCLTFPPVSCSFLSCLVYPAGAFVTSRHMVSPLGLSLPSVISWLLSGVTRVDLVRCCGFYILRSYGVVTSEIVLIVQTGSG